MSNTVHPPFVIGHRGAAGLAPENTIAGMEKARETGVRWVEFDVMLSKDRAPMVIHDDDVDRTTDGSGAVAEMTAAALIRLDAGGWFDRQFAGNGIPTLAAVVDFLAAHGMGANVEIKPYPGIEVETAEVVCAWVRANWPPSMPGVLISSFSADAMAVARDRLPDHDRAMLFDGLPSNWRDIVRVLDAKAVHLDDAATTEAVVEAMKDAGVALRVYTVNDPARAAELRAWGVASVFTDRPDLIKD